MNNGRNHQSTPQDLFDWAHARWGPFTLDACASSWNAKVPHYYGEEADGLASPWAGRVWCNPPWDRVDPWAERALLAVRQREAERVVMLVPARAGRGWWHNIIRPHALVLPVGRVQFAPPPGEPVGSGGFEDAVFAVLEGSPPAGLGRKK